MLKMNMDKYINSGPFGVQDKKTGYDNTIISYLNPLFDASVGKDKINLLLILSYPLFVISLVFGGLAT